MLIEFRNKILLPWIWLKTFKVFFLLTFDCFYLNVDAHWWTKFGTQAELNVFKTSAISKQSCNVPKESNALGKSLLQTTFVSLSKFCEVSAFFEGELYGTAFPFIKSMRLNGFVLVKTSEVCVPLRTSDVLLTR